MLGDGSPTSGLWILLISLQQMDSRAVSIAGHWTTIAT